MGNAVIDPKRLEPTDRLGLAWCRLNRYEWDPMFGEKPPGFGDQKEPSLFRKAVAKLRGERLPNEITYDLMRLIEARIGRANCSRCWWIFQLGRTEAEWRQWYYCDSIKDITETIREATDAAQADIAIK